MVLSRASSTTFAVKAEKWCDSAHDFLKLCADAGNVEALYTLGMVFLFFIYYHRIFSKRDKNINEIKGG